MRERAEQLTCRAGVEEALARLVFSGRPALRWLFRPKSLALGAAGLKNEPVVGQRLRSITQVCSGRQ